MTKTILITGSTDGIGLETAAMLAKAGHNVLLHGRNEQKLSTVSEVVSPLLTGNGIETYQADLMSFEAVSSMADDVLSRHDRLDALINNAGVYTAKATPGNLDPRFVVNAISPYLLTRRLLPILDADSRVVNVSSAAQAAVDMGSLEGRRQLSDSAAYAQSKLAITMWTMHLAEQWGASGPSLIAVNPASMLGSKMVKEAYGVSGGDLRVGASILMHAATSAEFERTSGNYYDNDRQAFAAPHADALNARKRATVSAAIAGLLEDWP